MKLGKWTTLIPALILIAGANPSPGASWSNPNVDTYNMHVGTQIFDGLYNFTTNSTLVEAAQAMTNMGSGNVIKFYLGSNYATKDGTPTVPGVTNLLRLARDEPSTRA